MRHTHILSAAAAVVAGLAFGASHAKAAALPKLDIVVSETGTVEPARYYRRWGYRPYRYFRPYRYYGPPVYYYGQPYSRYGAYRRWNRPYYGRRYWW